MHPDFEIFVCACAVHHRSRTLWQTSQGSTLTSLRACKPPTGCQVIMEREGQDSQKFKSPVVEFMSDFIIS